MFNNITIGYLYERLDGNTRSSDRDDSVKRFGNPAFNRFIMLLSTKAGKIRCKLTIMLFDWSMSQLINVLMCKGVDILMYS